MSENTDQVSLTCLPPANRRRLGNEICSNRSKIRRALVSLLGRKRLGLYGTNRAAWITALLLVHTLWLFSAGCASTRKGVGVLPPPSPDKVQFSSFQPQNAFVEVHPGISSRTLFVSDEQATTRVEVRDLLVSPKQKPLPLPLAGAAVFEVRSGTGAALIDSKRRELSVGTTFSVSQGESVQIETAGNEPLLLRMHLFGPK